MIRRCWMLLARWDAIFFRVLFMVSCLRRYCFANLLRPDISQPYTVAFQTQLLEVQKGDKILEIGTGSGYQATILSAMGAKVYSIERHYELYKRTKKLLETIDHKIFLFTAMVIKAFLNMPLMIKSLLPAVHQTFLKL